jgi:hypothetical protein
MKTILQLALAALVVYGCAQAGDSAWRRYQFEDAVHQETRFGHNETTSDLHRRILELAGGHGVELTGENVRIEQRGLETIVNVEYTEAINLVPGVYTHPQTYRISLRAQGMRPLTIDKKKR